MRSVICFRVSETAPVMQIAFPASLALFVALPLRIVGLTLALALAVAFALALALALALAMGMPLSALPSAFLNCTSVKIFLPFALAAVTWVDS